MSAQPAPSPGPVTPRRDDTEIRRPGEVRIGPYSLLARIGEGGMGVVHLARTADDRRVALKVLRPHVVGDAEARERLAREVTSLQRVDSPRVAEVLDADPHGPMPYIVTRYVPGLSLFHHVAEEGVLTGRDLHHLADLLAEALAAVHAAGVLHRDVKPTNVLMEGRSPVLIDFGLARLAEDPRLTQTGFLLGTPGYLAPEILYGDDPTPAADVHAWAATVVFAATGRPPYGRGPALAVMDRVRRGEHDLRDVPDELADLLAECLAPEPHERPTLREVREQLGGGRRQEVPRPRVTPEPELWTMPVHPADPLPSLDLPSLDAGPTIVVAPEPSAPSTPDVGPAPVVAPVPATRVLPPPAVQPAPASPERPVAEVRQLRPVPEPPVLPRRPSGLQRVLQLLGLAGLAAALVAYAPYAGGALVALAVLTLRATSLTRERHARRSTVRGRPRWYDVPMTTLAAPLYLVFALMGTLVVVLGSAIAAAALFSLGYLLGRPTETSLLLAGVAAVPALWWGPGGARVRESTRTFVTRTSRSEFGGWFVAVAAVVGAAVLVGLLLQTGPNWAPEVSAPWQTLR